MKEFLQFLTYFDWLALPRTVFQTFMHADWSTAGQKHGAPGIFLEAGASLIGTNTFPFFVPLDSPWGAAEIETLLRSKGIKSWGLGYANNEMFFRVSKKQAAWAQYLMLRAGVPLLHQLIAEGPGETGKSSLAAQEHAVGPAVTTPKRSDAFDTFMDVIDSLLP
jgi:hypothetical protein